MAQEKPYTFIVHGKKIEITEVEIATLPKQIETKEKELLDLRQLHSQAVNRQTLKFAMLLDRYYQNLSKHLLLYRSGIRVKFLTVMIQREFSPVYFVQAQIEFNEDKSFKSIWLNEINPTESKQLTHITKSKLFGTPRTSSIGSDKAFKKKCKRAAVLITENYVQRKAVGADKCNQMLKGWIAELF